MKTKNLVIWIAPNLNHYKVRMLNRLSKKREIELLVVSGSSDTRLGHSEDADDGLFRVIEMPIKKINFSKNIRTYQTLLGLTHNERPRWILMPIELKHLMVILFLIILRTVYRYQLVSINHPVDANRDSRLGKALKRLLFKGYDKVIFYTEHGLNNSIDNGDVKSSKAFFANNALDIDVAKSRFGSNKRQTEIQRSPGILFIGRLVPAKDVTLLIRYYKELKQLIPHLELYIIGDGPERNIVQKAIVANEAIHWLGGLSDESKIGSVFSLVDVVFVPGESGLAINHAFAYGKPFITVKNGVKHGPEIDYLENNVNGLLLGDDYQQNVTRIKELLTSPEELEEFQKAAYSRGKGISAEAWCDSIAAALCAK